MIYFESEDGTMKLCVLTLVSGLLFATAVYSQQDFKFDIKSVTGSWINPVGGTANSGIGTDVFATGEGTQTSLGFGFTTDLPKQINFGFPFPIGGVSVFNGTTNSGTAASGVSILIELSATTNDLVPSVTQTSLDSAFIHILNTPNSDDVTASQDVYWSSRFNQALYVNEGGRAAATLYAMLVPGFSQNGLALAGTSLDAEPTLFSLEIVGFMGAVTGDGRLAPNPIIPEPAVLALCYLMVPTGLTCRRRKPA